VRRDRRLAEILEAGTRVLAERGAHGTTMRHVAREAKTSLANLYSYVAGREDLLYRVHLHVLEVAVASAQAALGARGPRDRLRALVTDHVRRVTGRTAEADILRGAATPLRGDRARRVEDQRRRYRALVRAAADAALGAPRGGRRSEERVALLLGMADRVALDAAGSRAAARPDRLAAPVLRLFLAGARPSARRGP
jgi:AcrR family transcriptional regulator